MTSSPLQAHDEKPGSRRRRLLLIIAIGLPVLYLALLIPERKFQPPPGAGKSPFVWNQNNFWTELEQQFVKARQGDPAAISDGVNLGFAEAGKCLAVLKSRNLAPGAAAFAELEEALFRAAPLVAVSPQHLPQFAALVDSARKVTKNQSDGWDLKDPKAREQLYRVLFGGRMALEMVMVQLSNSPTVPAVCCDEPSATPSAQGLGIVLHSGDIFVSRGQAPTSSLISRGNDFPGNFSHVHVDEKTGKGTIIESLIERGVIAVPLEKFLAETRLRLMVLRPRADLPKVKADPQVPHRAAKFALAAANRGHTPYDFSMNFRDPRAQFCSEVVSGAYQQAGVALWMGMTYISSPTVTAWLASVGVRSFETQEPSDLEYDPQLRVVAEWPNPTNLFQAHLDDAVTDCMFAAAVPRAPLPHNAFKLPLARAAKAYSVGLNLLGHVGPIPEGMSATTALRVAQFREEHRLRKERLQARAAEFNSSKGYLPPYWELLNLARE